MTLSWCASRKLCSPNAHQDPMMWLKFNGRPLRNSGSSPDASLGPIAVGPPNAPHLTASCSFVQSTRQCFLQEAVPRDSWTAAVTVRTFSKGPPGSHDQITWWTHLVIVFQSFYVNFSPTFSASDVFYIFYLVSSGLDWFWLALTAFDKKDNAKPKQALSRPWYVETVKWLLKPPWPTESNPNRIWRIYLSSQY
jgi:hypothetical protein